MSWFGDIGNVVSRNRDVPHTGVAVPRQGPTPGSRDRDTAAIRCRRAATRARRGPCEKAGMDTARGTGYIT